MLKNIRTNRKYSQIVLSPVKLIEECAKWFQIICHTSIRCILYLLIQLFSCKFLKLYSYYGKSDENRVGKTDEDTNYDSQNNSNRKNLKNCSRYVYLIDSFLKCCIGFARFFIIFILFLDLTLRFALYIADSDSSIKFRICKNRGDDISVALPFSNLHCIREYNEDIIFIWDVLVSIAAISSSIFIFYATSYNKFNNYGLETWRIYLKNWIFSCSCCHRRKQDDPENGVVQEPETKSKSTKESKIKKFMEDLVILLIVAIAVCVAAIWIYVNTCYSMNFLKNESLANKTQITRDDDKLYYPTFLKGHLVITCLSSFHWHVSPIIAIIMIKYYCTYIKFRITCAISDSKKYIKTNIEKLSAETCSTQVRNDHKREVAPNEIMIINEKRTIDEIEGVEPAVSYSNTLAEVKQLTKLLGILPTVLVGTILLAIAGLIIEYFSTVDIKQGLYYFLIKKNEAFEITRFATMYTIIFCSVSLMLNSMARINGCLDMFGDKLETELRTRNISKNTEETTIYSNNKNTKDATRNNVDAEQIGDNRNNVECENVEKFIKKMKIDICLIKSSKGRFEIAYFGIVGQDLLNLLNTLGVTVIMTFIIQVVLINKILDNEI